MEALGAESVEYMKPAAYVVFTSHTSTLNFTWYNAHLISVSNTDVPVCRPSSTHLGAHVDFAAVIFELIMLLELLSGAAFATSSCVNSQHASTNHVRD